MTKEAYRRPVSRPDVDLRLDANEGRAPSPQMVAALRDLDGESLRRYPDVTELETMLAVRLDVPASQVLVTAGADDGIDRCCRLALGEGGSLLMPRPGFEMFARYARLAGGEVDSVEWQTGPFPTSGFEAAVSDATRVIAVISPNNPTGLVASAEDVRHLARRAPKCLIVVDAAYAEFADEDLTSLALEFDNVVALRSFSKAWGLAGLRVGYAVANPGLIARLRAAGPPYAVSAPSLALAAEALRSGDGLLQATVAAVRGEREALAAELRMLGAAPIESQANFVLARFAGADRIWEDLQALGIAVRRWPNDGELGGFLRIGCPADPEDFLRLGRALRTVLRPDAILFDMDGVLADEGPSYREAILVTAQSFGVAVDRQDVREVKADGGANNDWDVTHRLVRKAGVVAEYEEVVDRFESAYQGTDGKPGLCEQEVALVDPRLLDRLAENYKLGIVTGRPRRDAERFLNRFGLERYFDCVVTADDAPAKPDPAPVELALSRLGVRSAWMIGDTPDDARAARAADVLPLGILPPDEQDAVSPSELVDAGCARVLDRLERIEELLP
jgi:histidinol-phosphate aminotransferase